MVEVLTRVHAVGDTHAGPAPEIYHIRIVITGYHQHGRRRCRRKGQPPLYLPTYDCATVTYRKRHRNTAIMCVLVVARDSTDVRTWAWQLGHWMLTGSGPTAGSELH